MRTVAGLALDVAAVLGDAPVWSRYVRGGARAEAVLLVEHVLGEDLDAPGVAEREASDELVRAIEALLRRRIQERVPVPHLVGRTRYDGMRLDASERLFIPRNALEYVLDDVVESVPWSAVPRALDLCCGIGAVGLAVARRVPGLLLDQADVDPHAVEVAGRNAQRLGLAGRVEGAVGDLFDALPRGRRYDLVTANPPYVPARHGREACPEAHHEPPGAIFGEGDGLGLTRAIVAAAPRWLAPRGVLVLECSPAQHDHLAWMLAGRGRWWEHGGRPLHLVSVTRDQLVG